MTTLLERASDLTKDLHGVWFSQDRFETSLLCPATAVSLQANTLEEVATLSADLKDVLSNGATIWFGWHILYEANNGQHGRKASWGWSQAPL